MNNIMIDPKLALSIVAGVLVLACLGWIYSLFVKRRSSKIRQKRMERVLEQLKLSSCCGFDHDVQTIKNT